MLTKRGGRGFMPWGLPFSTMSLLFVLQQGFDQLQMFVINASAYPGGKVSKAVILEKSKCGR